MLAFAVFPAHAGWITARANTRIRLPVEAALLDLVQQGQIAQLEREWLPPATCLPESSAATDGGIEQIGVQVSIGCRL